MTRKPTAYILLLVTACALLAGCSTDGSYMRQRLQYVSDCNRADTVFTARWLPTVDTLVGYFDRHGSANDRMMAHYLKGRVHHDMGESPQALECYQRAAEQADTTRSDCDLYTLYAVYGQMANIFDVQYLPDDEMQALKIAERIAWKDKDTLTALYTYELRKKPYFLRNDTDSILHIERRARNLYLQIQNDSMAARTSRVPISLLLDRGQYDEAGYLIRFFEGNSYYFDSSNNIRKKYEIYYYDKGRYLLASGKPDSSLFYFTKVLQAGYKEAGYKGLLMYYQKKHIADSIAKYATLFAKANDDSYLHVNQNAVHQISAMYDYGRQQRLAEESRATAARQKNYLVYAFFAFLFAAAIAAFSYNRVRIQNLLRISQLLKAKADLQSLLEEKQAQLDIFISKNASEIERITQESNQILIEHIREKKALEQQIEDMNRKLSLFSGASREKAFLNTPIYAAIQSHLGKAGDVPLSDDEWEQLHQMVNAIYPNFREKLTSLTSINNFEYQVCLLLKIGVKPSDIASLTAHSRESVTASRRRLYEKAMKKSGKPSDWDALVTIL